MMDESLQRQFETAISELPETCAECRYRVGSCCDDDCCQVKAARAAMVEWLTDIADAEKKKKKKTSKPA